MNVKDNVKDIVSEIAGADAGRITAELYAKGSYMYSIKLANGDHISGFYDANDLWTPHVEIGRSNPFGKAYETLGDSNDASKILSAMEAGFKKFHPEMEKFHWPKTKSNRKRYSMPAQKLAALEQACLNGQHGVSGAIGAAARPSY